MYVQDTGQRFPMEGLNFIEAEFITEHLSIIGEVRSPELRLSDHLNGSAPSVEIRPRSVMHGNRKRVDLTKTVADLTKSQLMLVIPQKEPERRSGPSSSQWAHYVTGTCWAALGEYELEGHVHVEAHRDPRLLLRALEQRHFLPFSNVTLTYPHGETRQVPVVIVNRWHLEVLAVQPEE
jgi:hypothetical protein